MITAGTSVCHAACACRSVCSKYRLERCERHGLRTGHRPNGPGRISSRWYWLGEGKWPDGSALRVEVRYFWGPTKRVLHFETYDLAGEQRKLIYEGILFFDAKRGKIVQYNFKPTGEIDESELTEATSKGYEVRGANTRSLVHYLSTNVFRWELQALRAGEWKVILDATYQRKN